MNDEPEDAFFANSMSSEDGEGKDSFPFLSGRSPGLYESASHPLHGSKVRSPL